MTKQPTRAPIEHPVMRVVREYRKLRKAPKGSTVQILWADPLDISDALAIAMVRTAMERGLTLRFGK